MPAYIHAIRLTTVADALQRLTAICTHLEGNVNASPANSAAKIEAHDGIEDGIHNRGEVETCVRHARLIASVLEWLSSHELMKDATVIECHGSQSYGAADLVVLLRSTVWLFEAGSGTGNNVLKKHRQDLKLLNAEQLSLLRGAVVTEVQKFRVVPPVVLGELPLTARNAVVAHSDAFCIVRC